MSTYTFDEFTLILWVDDIASLTAPTVAELNAGVDLTEYVTKAGLKLGAENSTVPNDNISTSYKGERPGTYSNKASLEILRDNEDDVAWETLSARLTEGNLVVRRGVLYTTAVAASQVVEVYPAITQQPEIPDSAENTRVTANIPLAIPEEPELNAVVAA
jgi:hypothetical protein